MIIVTPQQNSAIDKALDQGYRVQLKKLKDGTVKIQIVSMKELKLDMIPAPN